jgi:cyclomaltodextrinase / maltogenic alpha-amylase / neopullulanase
MQMTKTALTTIPAPNVSTPDWVKDAVFYQIFPDRFAKSERVEKPHNLETWDSPPTRHGFKGGDLMGIAEHLDYLVDLGVDAIYLTPIFQSTANHRYHTFDYYRVDPILGDNTAFKALLDEAHSRGLRIILDGVFNHASRGFYQFNHTLENGNASPYLDWFRFKNFPPHAYDDYGPAGYDAWWGLKALPRFNHQNPQVREFIMQVAEHWIRQGIDGWRLDVPAEIDDDDFWREFRARVKRANPEAYIVGEIWHRATRWLAGDQFDAVMNYQFTRACLNFFLDVDDEVRRLTAGHSYGEVSNWDAPTFSLQLQEALEWYPAEITYAQLNLLDSHDTSRFLTVAKNDAAALKLANLTMMTYPGAPMIYYGDEIGMLGGKDPDCRRSMLWDESRWDHDLRATVKRHVSLRRKYRSLRRGDFSNLYSQGKVCIFARHLESETVIVALNASQSAAALDLEVASILANGVSLREEWGSRQVTVKDGRMPGMRIPARDGVVWSVEN